MHPATHVEGFRDDITEFLAALDKLRSRNYEYVQAGMGAAVTDQVMIDVMNTTEPGGNTPLATAADFQAAVSSVQHFLSEGDAGHATNLYKLKR